MDYNYTKGEEILLELNDECFVGKFEFMNKKRTRILVTDVTDFQTGRFISDQQYFYESEIFSIKLLEKPKTFLDYEEEEKEEESSSSSISKDLAFISAEELKEIENRARSAILISKMDGKYDKAINNLKMKSKLVINLESCSMGRSNNTTVLSISTNDDIYIFDIVYFGGIPKELKEILESKNSLKIMFNASKIVDNLKQRQNVCLSKIFDILVAHIAFGGDRNIIKLNECISFYFNLPVKYINDAENINWYQRPLDKKYEIITAKKTLFIYKLYKFLLENKILYKVFQTCEAVSLYYSNNSDNIDVSCDMATNMHSCLQNIEEIDIKSAVQFNNLHINSHD